VGDCLLEAQWNILRVEGPQPCTSLSSAFEARWFRWQDQKLASLDPVVAPFASVGATLERLRFCARPLEAGLSEFWRFEEKFELGGPLSGSSCPSEPFRARYEYVEHGDVSGRGRVFGTDQEAACRFEACVTFVPRAASAVTTPPLGSEAQCRRARPSEPTRVARKGERCIGTECVAGTFCSLELPDGTCAAEGDGTCQDAPRAEACPAEIEPVCRCSLISQVPDTNRCEQRARGYSTETCL
jgi:hypothetical protein